MANSLVLALGVLAVMALTALPAEVEGRAAAGGRAAIIGQTQPSSSSESTNAVGSDDEEGRQVRGITYREPETPTLVTLLHKVAHGQDKDGSAARQLCELRESLRGILETIDVTFQHAPTGTETCGNREPNEI